MPPKHLALERFLDRLRSRSPLSDEEQEAILGVTVTSEEVRAHRQFLAPGRCPNHASLVSDGIVARFDQMKNGERQLTAFHIPGDMCNLYCATWPTTESGLIAVSAATVLHVPHSELRKLVTHFPGIAVAFWTDISVDMSLLSKWIATLGRRDARQRLAHLICELAFRLERAGLGDRTAFQLNITQESLGEALGLSGVHVNRTIQTLRSEGLIRSVGRMIYIDDWERICSVADFKPDYLLLPELTARRSSSRRARSERGAQARPITTREKKLKRQP